MTDRAKCVVLVPANYGIEPECERALGQLERLGYPVWRVPGFAAIDQCRNQVATDALARGFDELMWIDADTSFAPESVERLRSHGLPLVAGIAAKKGHRALAVRLLPETKEVVFGVGGGLTEVMYAGTGFLHTRREVYGAIQRRCELPVCNERFGKLMVPYFMPIAVREDDSPSRVDSTIRQAHDSPRARGKEASAGTHAYLGDDFSFCHRARQAGYKIYADTTIRLGHIGRYAFSWEEAGGSNQRFGTYIYRVLDAEK